jgi:hypothetical protein
MTCFVVGDDHSQSTLFPELLDDYLGEDNQVRAVDIFVDELQHETGNAHSGRWRIDGSDPRLTQAPRHLVGLARLKTRVFTQLGPVSDVLIKLRLLFGVPQPIASGSRFASNSCSSCATPEKAPR